MIQCGADKVLLAEDAAFKGYVPELWVTALETICRELEPETILISQSNIGADLGPRIAFRLGTCLTADCLDLSVDPETKSLLCTKPIYGGNVIAVYTSKYRPHVATIREKAFLPAERDGRREGEIVSYVFDRHVIVKRIEFIEKIKDEIPGLKLEEADVIICGGRGVGNPEECDGFEQLDELAKILGGAVAGSRPVCEKGWVHPRLQVGLTGKKVTPRLYIAVGVSGASQHLAGMLGSKSIVAINNDPKANIFKEAHFGAIGDYKEILPGFRNKVMELFAAE
jgi:electron transfer flavoprotein alpha subunit